VVFDVAERVTMPGIRGRVLVLERRLQAMPMLALVRGGLGQRRHDDVGMEVALRAVGPVRVLDNLQEPVRVRFRIMVMMVLVLVIVPMRHGSMLG